MYLFEIEVWCNIAQGLARCQDELDSFIDPETATSIEAAIEGDQTLGGLVDYAVCTGITRAPRFGALNSERANALVARLGCEVMI